MTLVGNNLFLGFWTVYAALGIAQVIFQFTLSFSFVVAGLIASLNLFQIALRHVLRSPVSFFDTTPMGRIMSLRVQCS
ncbi:hypothetical protein BT96DRAFT_1092087 [Gymnopus androsaceus JB14]|uniref:ABC transmembrane type-1 domain-containing protein n=1 Tax=Gymnopus androsaceus JB14 TaxID=1447944 RepID=A0A6A4GJ46_9AGAR|nr:hypothetical protein BT96DRAFT_1092087 [Gymnopus androsaceus JB14]